MGGSPLVPSAPKVWAVVREGDGRPMWPRQSRRGCLPRSPSPLKHRAASAAMPLTIASPDNSDAGMTRQSAHRYQALAKVPALRVGLLRAYGQNP